MVQRKMNEKQSTNDAALKILGWTINPSLINEIFMTVLSLALFVLEKTLVISTD
ncbi:hypothetical protein QJS10_CPA16g00435 [Acorus calamus]|uniref:Uncharacterized protein n=1 Tax=Acorus calamus TaxID=4465 RepID=A0AAV9CXP0_ACOCL|nr:hypothetical protein QJS10_CPA16g00435 [Acorus calamus]